MSNERIDRGIESLKNIQPGSDKDVVFFKRCMKFVLESMKDKEEVSPRYKSIMEEKEKCEHEFVGLYCKRCGEYKGQPYGGHVDEPDISYWMDEVHRLRIKERTIRKIHKKYVDKPTSGEPFMRDMWKTVCNFCKED